MQRIGPMYVETQDVEMLTFIGGLCCVGFINPVGVTAGVHPKKERSYVCWVHLSRLHLKTETEHGIQNCDKYVIIPSPQTYR
jgi:hypothetical protein